MIPYFITFIIAVVFSIFSEQFYKTNKWFSVFAAFFAILFPSILAGARDLWVGVDLGTYGNKVFLNNVNSPNFITSESANRGIEFGYNFFNFIVSRFTRNENIYLFLMALFLYTLTYAGIIQFRKYCSVPLAYSVYLLLLYTQTLTMLRQGIATTLVVFGVGLFINGKKKLSILVLVTGLLFHNSAFFGFVILLIWFGIKYIKSYRLEKTVGLLLLACIVATWFGALIIDFLSAHNILNDKYTNTLTIAQVSWTEGVSIGSLYRLFFILLFIFIWRDVKKSRILVFFFAIVTLDSIFTLLFKGSAGIYAARIAYYFTWFSPVGYVVTFRYVQNRYLQQFISVVSIFVLALVFIHVMMKSGINMVGSGRFYPYSSTILGIGH